MAPTVNHFYLQRRSVELPRLSMAGANIINMSPGGMRSGQAASWSDIIAQGEQRGIAFYAAANKAP